MSNSLYLVRNKQSERKIDSLIQKYNLELCYDTKNEKVLKNENILLLLKKKYIFLRVFSGNNCLFPEVQQSLRA